MDLRESALIEVAGHNLNQWAKKGPNFRFFPSFIAKNGQKNPRTKCGGFLVRVQERLFSPVLQKNGCTPILAWWAFF